MTPAVAEPVAVGMEVEVVTCYGSCADHEGQRGQVAHVYADLVDVLLDGVWWRGCLATQVRRVEAMEQSQGGESRAVREGY